MDCAACTIGDRPNHHFPRATMASCILTGQIVALMTCPNRGTTKRSPTHVKSSLTVEWSLYTIAKCLKIGAIKIKSSSSV
jgi:hypothetical protein